MKRLVATMCALALLGCAMWGADADHYPPAPTGGYPAWVMDTINTTTTVLDTIWAPTGYRIARFDIANISQTGSDAAESLWVKFTITDTTSPVSCTDSFLLHSLMDGNIWGIGVSRLASFPVSCVRIELAGTQASGAVASAHWSYIAYCVSSTGDGHGGVTWP